MIYIYNSERIFISCHIIITRGLMVKIDCVFMKLYNFYIANKYRNTAIYYMWKNVYIFTVIW